MEDKSIKAIREAQEALSKLLEGQDKGFVDSVAGISATLDAAIQAAEANRAEYDDMRNDYIAMVKNTKFAKPGEDPVAEPQEKTLEEIIAAVTARK